MNTREALPEVCRQSCNAAKNSYLCDEIDAFSSDCEGPVPSSSGLTTSEVRFSGDPLVAEEVFREKAVTTGILVCRNIGLDSAVQALIDSTNENEGRLF